MQSDLRNLMSQQELYFSLPANGYSYANSVGLLTDFVPSQGVTVGVTTGNQVGWGATASHAALASTQTCAVFAGTVGTIPAPALTPGVILCTNE